MTVFLILTAIAYGIFKTGCFILLVVKGALLNKSNFC